MLSFLILITCWITHLYSGYNSKLLVETASHTQVGHQWRHSSNSPWTYVGSLEPDARSVFWDHKHTKQTGWACKVHTEEAWTWPSCYEWALTTTPPCGHQGKEYTAHIWWKFLPNQKLLEDKSIASCYEYSWFTVCLSVGIGSFFLAVLNHHDPTRW